MAEKTVKMNFCWQCGYFWLPRKKDNLNFIDGAFGAPYVCKLCPRCGSIHWNEKDYKKRQFKKRVK